MLGTGALCLAIGLGIGAFFAGSAPTTALPAQVAATAPAARDGLARAELAAIIRQELARERASAPTTGAGAVAHHQAADDAALDRGVLAPELADQAERATQIVGDALASGAWTEADKAALTQQLEGLPGPIMAEIAGQLAAAVNAGAVRLDLDSLPL